MDWTSYKVCGLPVVFQSTGAEDYRLAYRKKYTTQDILINFFIYLHK